MVEVLVRISGLPEGIEIGNVYHFRVGSVTYTLLSSRDIFGPDQNAAGRTAFCDYMPSRWGSGYVSEGVLVLDCKYQKRVDTVEIELLANVEAVVVNSLHTYVEKFSNFLACPAVGDQLQDIPFGSCEALEAWMIVQHLFGPGISTDEVFRHPGADITVSLKHGLDASEEVVLCSFLQKISSYAEVHHGIEDFLLLMHRHNDDLD